MRVLLFLTAAAAFGQTGFDVLSLNRAVDPCGNFYKFACGGWQAANPIPGDVARWGNFDALQDRNRTLLQNVLETASAERAGRTAIEQKIGDFYAACMNDEVQNRRSMDTFQRDVNRIGVIDNKTALTELVVTLFKIGAGPFFNFSSEQDAKDSANMIAGIDQGGLGLPDRDYYLKSDVESVEIRARYLAHLQRIFALLGQEPAVAQRNAAAAMAIETALAQGSMDRVARRDPEKVYHKLTVDQLKALAPNFDWTAFFAGLGAPQFASLNVAVPEFVQGFGKIPFDVNDAVDHPMAMAQISPWHRD